jgi:hypothetical protein
MAKLFKTGGCYTCTATVSFASSSIRSLFPDTKQLASAVLGGPTIGILSGHPLRESSVTLAYKVQKRRENARSRQRSSIR